MAPDVDLSWQAQAACRGLPTDVFFAPERHGADDPAKRVCASCPVTEACLDYALVQRIRDGIFGGLSPTERTALARATAAA